ncbi:MAG TPA: folate family ECF transporter S component [Clostridiales bacterium]|nr:folate family ECF transporter S component [Clostridiales bacterium]
MKNTLSNLKASSRELKNVYVLSFCGILLALRVVLGFLEITIGDAYRISFSALPVSLGAYMFGPIPGAIIGAFGDIVTLIIKPTGAINIGILCSKALSGFIIGLFLYKQPISLKRTILANITVTILCNIVITTFSLCIVYGYPLMAILPVRIVTNLILLPFNIALLFGAEKLVEKMKFPKLKISK